MARGKSREGRRVASMLVYCIAAAAAVVAAACVFAVVSPGTAHEVAQQAERLEQELVALHERHSEVHTEATRLRKHVTDTHDKLADAETALKEARAKLDQEVKRRIELETQLRSRPQVAQPKGAPGGGEVVVKPKAVLPPPAPVARPQRRMPAPPPPTFPTFKDKSERKAHPDQPVLDATADFPVPPMLSRIGVKRGDDVFVTFATGTLAEFAVNWVSYLERGNMRPYFVGSMDQQMYDECERRGIPTIMVNGSDILADRDLNYFKPGHSVFRKMGTVKTKFILELLQVGLNPILSDADVVWIRDPREYLSRGNYQGADVLISTDCIDLPGDMRDDGSCAHVNFNTGTLHFKATPGAKVFVKAWHDSIWEHFDLAWMRDQPAFNLLIREQTNIWKQWHDTPKPADGTRKIFPVYEGRVKLGPLPSWLFTSGHVYFVQEVERKWREDPSGLDLKSTKDMPFAVHTTYQYGDAGEYPYGKRQRLREHHLWAMDPDSYYTGRFLSLGPLAAAFEPEVLPVKGTDTRYAVRKHFAEDNYRRPAIRAALAVAKALNRTLIMPKAYCYADNLWNNLISGRAPGAESQLLPYVCPMDHIYRLPFWFKAANAGWVDFREYSFLDNPRVPQHVRGDVARVRVDAGAGGGNPAASGAFTGGGAAERTIRAGLKDAEIREALAGLEGRAVIELDQVAPLFCGHADPAAARAFREHDDGVLHYHMYYCLTEAWKEAGAPRSNPWQPNVVERHCGIPEHTIIPTKKIRFGEIMDMKDCFCEWGFKTPKEWPQCSA